MREWPPKYFSYLLRVWRTGQGQEAIWRASLECPLTGEHHDFPDTQKLWDFLQECMRVEDDETIHKTFEGD